MADMSERQPWELRDESVPPEQQRVNPTSEAVDEGERGSGSSGRQAPSRSTNLLLLGLSFAVVVAVAAAVTMGAEFTVPVLILVVLVVGVVAGARYIAARKTRQHGDRTRDAVADDAEDPLPHFGFEDSTDVGATPEAADEDSEAHSDLGPSTGKR